MTDLDPSAGAADDAGPRVPGRARSKAGEAEDLRDARISVRWLPVESLTPDPENARVHGPRQIARIADSIAAFGFNVPVLIDGKGAVLAGHGRVLAARRLGLSEVPTIALEHLSEPERRAFMIADNRLAELASWDDRRLGVELKALKSLDLDFSIEATGFELDEIELKIDPRNQVRGQPRAREKAGRRLEGFPGCAAGRRVDAWASSPPVRRRRPLHNPVRGRRRDPPLAGDHGEPRPPALDRRAFRQGRARSPQARPATRERRGRGRRRTPGTHDVEGARCLRRGFPRRHRSSRTA